MLVLQYFLKKGANIIAFSLMLTMVFISPGTAKEELKLASEIETAKYQADLGAYHWQKGDLHQAIEAWSKEAEIYQSKGLSEREAEAILKVSQGYTSLGQLNISIFYLERLLSSVKDSSVTALVLEQLGNARLRNGELDKAKVAYSKSLELEESQSTLNNLVRLLKEQNLQAKLQAESSRKGKDSERYLDEAESYRTEAMKYAKQALSLNKAERHSASIYTLIEWGDLASGLSAFELTQGRRILENLSPSRTKALMAIKWAKLDGEQEDYWLSQAQLIAGDIEDELTESYALLELGFLAEKSGDTEKALKYAYAAQLKAQSKSAYGSLYRAQWLAGRIHKEKGNKEAALVNYRGSIASLDVLSQNTKTINVRRRIGFKTKIEPIYREMISLLLEDSSLSESDLKDALVIFDKLRLAQLQQYFGDNCFEIDQTSLPIEDALAAKNAVLLKSIILDEQTYLILQLPDGTIRHSKARMGKTAIAKIANDWYGTIKNGRDWNVFSKGQELYNLILRPFEQELEQINPSQIIFVHDGILRNLPMPVLFDGEKFLAQKWASVSSIGLAFKPSIKEEKASEAVAFGLGVKRGEWSKLDYIEQEIEAFITIVGGQGFINEEFTTDKFAQELSEERHSVIHIAAHGYFGGVAENSFVLAYNKPLSALDLKDFILGSKAKIELLVLSACETAISSDRSALGLAGVALRSGVSSVLGSYWNVKDDKQLELMTAFYSYHQDQNLGLAQALQQVQIEQIDAEAHPSRWAALNFIEN